MPTLLNPTDEQLKTMHDGISYIFESGDTKRVETAVGRHILTHFQARGIVLLEYGDDTSGAKEVKIEDALKRQKTFELKQIRAYNVDNEKRKRQGKLWVEPPAAVVHFATKHNVKLEEFFSEADVKNKELSEAVNRAFDAEKQVATLTEQLTEVMAFMKESKVDKLKQDEIAGLDKRTREYKDRVAELEEDIEEE